MTCLHPLVNRQPDPAAPFRLPADGWYQLAPAGEFPVQADSPPERLVQVLDEQAFSAILASFQEEAVTADFPGLLVDFDHFSLDLDKASEAAGWIVELALRDGALWGRIRWSERGGQAVTGGSYRFLSPVFDRPTAEDLGGGRVRPLRLLSAGLTNDPNLRGIRPLSNRNGGVPPQAQEAARMKQQLAEILGLGPNATDEELAAKVQELAAKAKAAEEELAKLKQEGLETRVEEDIEKHKDQIADPKKAKEALLANREAALGILAAIRPSPRPDRLPNRRSARVPAADPGDDEGSPAAVRNAAAIRNRAAVIQREQGLNYRSAFRLAKDELGG